LLQNDGDERFHGIFGDIELLSVLTNDGHHLLGQTAKA
jgi:hypothetical protein